MNYIDELKAIYDSEINFRLSCFWDAGWYVRIGDTMNGWKHSTCTDTLEEAIEWLVKTIREKYPESGYVKKQALSFSFRDGLLKEVER